MDRRAAVWKNATDSMASKLITEPHFIDGSINYSVEYLPANKIARIVVDHTICPNGSIFFDVHFKPMMDSLPDIPRMGMKMLLPGEYTGMSWYGRGPHETYWDRKSSGRIGIWEGEISDQYHRYPRPQETGNKTDLRWLEISSNDIYLYTESMDQHLLNGSAWPFTTDELDFVPGKDGGESASGLVPVTSRHGADIREGKLVQVNIDHKQMGVGGDTSWGRQVHDEYTIPAEQYRYSFIIRAETIKTR